MPKMAFTNSQRAFVHPDQMHLCNANHGYRMRFSGATNVWASGVLFNIVNVDGGASSFKNRAPGWAGSGAGRPLDSVLWQCSASPDRVFLTARCAEFCIRGVGTVCRGRLLGECERGISSRWPALHFALLADRLGEAGFWLNHGSFSQETEASSNPDAIDQIRRIVSRFTSARRFVARLRIDQSFAAKPDFSCPIQRRSPQWNPLIR